MNFLYLMSHHFLYIVVYVRISKKCVDCFYLFERVYKLFFIFFVRVSPYPQIRIIVYNIVFDENICLFRWTKLKNIVCKGVMKFVKSFVFVRMFIGR